MDILLWLKSKYDIDVKDTSLLRDAFTHSSYINEAKEFTNDYERLEFMGDAVVEIWVTNKLFYHTPSIPEGKMTTMRAQLVCEKSLASFLRKMDLAKYIRLGVGEERTGGRDRDSLLCDVFEAFIGAVYLDQGYKTVEKILDDAISIVDNPELTGIVDYKTKLQEYVQTDSRKELKYQVLETSGTANFPSFKVGVYHDGLLLGIGEEHSKKKAEQLAAKEALGKLAK